MTETDLTAIENRKVFLRRVESVYQETKFWILSLSNDRDKEFFVSKGYNGVELYLILYIVIPILFVIECGYNGVPLLVSFFKRRLKRKGARKGDRKGENHHVKKVNVTVYKPIKCCSNCDEAKLKKLQKKEVKKAERRQDKKGNSRRNFLKRLKKRVKREFKTEKLAHEFVPPTSDIDQLFISVPPKEKVYNSKVNRFKRRVQKILSCEKPIKPEFVLPFLMKFGVPNSKLWCRVNETTNGWLVDGDFNLRYIVNFHPGYLKKLLPGRFPSDKFRFGFVYMDKGTSRGYYNQQMLGRPFKKEIKISELENVKISPYNICKL